MRAETWMNHTPRPSKTPLQQAKADLRHWSARERELYAQLGEAQKQRVAASERIEELTR